MLCGFYAQVVRREDHERMFAVRVWRIEDWFDPQLNVKGIESIKPTIEFPCENGTEANLLCRRLTNLREALDGRLYAL